MDLYSYEFYCMPPINLTGRLIYTPLIIELLGLILMRITDNCYLIIPCLQEPTLNLMHKVIREYACTLKIG